jgi:glycosyltransferase involved in cell wall biosynthesis
VKISIFTPTHDGKHLLEAYESLVRQTVHDWEWVIVPNGAALIPIEIMNDQRVKVEPAPELTGKVGALKKFAVAHCTGDILVELDHDDMLAPEALAEIHAAMVAGATFVYSDFANFRHDGTSEVYNPAHGWETYQYGGYTAHKAFETNASSLSQIFYAPNHVRAWTRALYDQVGGHDPGCGICDDYDLICRTYLSGSDMVHISKCLYLYRLQGDGANTYLQRNAEIQAKQQEVSNKYIYQMIYEWARRESLPMYDLGGAIGKPEGFLSVDLHDADVIYDINRGLPFADNSVGVIRAYDFLEHIPHCVDSRCWHIGCTVGLLNEIYRVLAPGGWLLTACPDTSGRGAFQDPTHVSFWNPNSWFYFCRQEQAKYVPGIKARFQRNRCWIAHPTEWHKTHEIPYVYADLVALKGQRQPGIVEI